VGAEPELIRYALENVGIGADAGGRKPGRDVRLLARLACSVADDPDWAREEVKGYAAAAAGTIFTSIPEDAMPTGLRSEIERMKREYDYYEHTSSKAHHKQLLSDRVVDAVSVTGTPEEVAPRLRALVELGVQGFVIPVTSSDPEKSMRSLATIIPGVAQGARA
jgi:alkanesulfonate monooxygenase SsuD/methylene tetrahydromethanopterin reductase-like flavin-dependent oxidoreductase (luciferase family)